MSISKIPSSAYTFAYSPPGIDAEEKEIMLRLRAHGRIPTGDKATDRAVLRRIEEELARQDNIVSNKYLTISPAEQKSMLEIKKAKQKLNNPEKFPDRIDKQNKMLGAKYQGEQIYLAIKMKDTSQQPRK